MVIGYCIKAEGCALWIVAAKYRIQLALQHRIQLAFLQHRIQLAFDIYYTNSPAMSSLREFAPVLASLALLGWQGEESPMSTDRRWSTIHELKGWLVCRDFADAVKTAHLKRHPRHNSYIPTSEARRLTDEQGAAYGRLNNQLHEELRRVSREYFKDVPVPKEIKRKRALESYFTPFTYQNYDWYGPSYECYVGVLKDYVSAELLRRFQFLLRDEYQDWCIRVVGSNDATFDHDHDIAVFSDQVLMPVGSTDAFQVPKRYR